MKKSESMNELRVNDCIKEGNLVNKLVNSLSSIGLGKPQKGP